MADDAPKPPPRFWIRDDQGVPSVTVTFTALAFLTTTAAYGAAIVEKLSVFGQELSFRSFDVGACSAYFVPILTLYFGRKFTKAKFGADAGATKDAAPPSGQA